MKIFIGRLIDLLEKEPKDKIVDISLIPDGYKILEEMLKLNSVIRKRP